MPRSSSQPTVGPDTLDLPPIGLGRALKRSKDDASGPPSPIRSGKTTRPVMPASRAPSPFQKHLHDLRAIALFVGGVVVLLSLRLGGRSLALGAFLHGALGWGAPALGLALLLCGTFQALEWGPPGGVETRAGMVVLTVGFLSFSGLLRQGGDFGNGLAGGLLRVLHHLVGEGAAPPCAQVLVWAFNLLGFLMVTDRPLAHWLRMIRSGFHSCIARVPRLPARASIHAQDSSRFPAGRRRLSTGSAAPSLAGDDNDVTETSRTRRRRPGAVSAADSAPIAPPEFVSAPSLDDLDLPSSHSSVVERPTVIRGEQKKKRRFSAALDLLLPPAAPEPDLSHHEAGEHEANASGEHGNGSSGDLDAPGSLEHEVNAPGDPAMAPSAAPRENARPTGRRRSLEEILRGIPADAPVEELPDAASVDLGEEFEPEDEPLLPESHSGIDDPAPSIRINRPAIVPNARPSVPAPHSGAPHSGAPHSEAAYSEAPYSEAPASPPLYPDLELPPSSLLQLAGPAAKKTQDEANATVMILEQTLQEFKVAAKVVEIAEGPTLTRYELQLAPGILVKKIVSLADNINMALAAIDVRVEAPIPGKSAIGIEVPKRSPGIVGLRELVDTPEFRNAPRLTFALGRDVSGNAQYADLARMPHLLIAGSTGSGKSACLNTLITSLLFRTQPEELRFVMIDPKRVELSLYEGIPHLCHQIVRDSKRAPQALGKVMAEMDRRYLLLQHVRTRDIIGYNSKVEQHEKLPYIVVVIDELADLMMTSGPETEHAIIRLAQLARAVGIHLVVATQRPSVDIVTGKIKANVPSRIAFAVSSGVDSRTILDTQGAERLIGRGDMLFIPIDANKPRRIQGAYISEQELERVVEFWRSKGTPDYYLEHAVIPDAEPQPSGDSDDDLYSEAVRVVLSAGQASTSMLQRKLKIGYNRAATLVELMEEYGVVGPQDGVRPREVLISRDQWEMSQSGEI